MPDRIKKTLKEQMAFVDKKTGLFTRVGHHDRTIDLVKRYQEALIIAIDCLESVWEGNTQGVRKRLYMNAVRRINETIRIPKVKINED